jgi:hypothetical protein
VLLGYLGQASYEGYLLHIPIYRLVANYLWTDVNPTSLVNAGLLVVVIGLASFLVNRTFTEPVNRLVRNRLGKRGAPERLRPIAPIVAASVLLAIPLLVVVRDTRHPSSVVSASVNVRRADLGGAAIPVFVYGEAGDADFISIGRRGDDVQVKFDHWGYASVTKTVRRELTKGDFTVTLDCRAPALVVGGETVLGPEDLEGFRAHDEIAIGKNDIGGTTMAVAAGSELGASTLTFNNGSQSDARTWRRGDSGPP